MKEELIQKAYEVAKERYAAIGVDVEKAMDALQKISLSLHCWQADDVAGFEAQGALTGGIQATGNYPGKARNMEELRQDVLKAASYIPGTHRLNLHEIYGDFGGKFVDRDQVEPAHFESWIQWAAENNMKLDFNSTSFSHPKSGNLSLSNPDKGIRDFWVEHTKRCRAIAEEMGKRQGDPCIMNLWVHDGSKDITVNRMLYRELLKDSLDRIFEVEYKNMKDCVESKVFGIGLESYTVGSADVGIVFIRNLSFNKRIQNCTFHGFILVKNHFFLKFHDVCLPFLFLFLRHLIRHFRCRCSFLRGISKRSETVKFHIIDKLHQFFVLLFCLPRESADQRGPQSDIRDTFSQIMDSLDQFLFICFSSHALQNCIVAVLDRHVQIVTDLFILNHGIDQFLIDFLRITVHNTNPEQTGNPVQAV